MLKNFCVKKCLLQLYVALPRNKTHSEVSMIPPVSLGTIPIVNGFPFPFLLVPECFPGTWVTCTLPGGYEIFHPCPVSFHVSSNIYGCFSQQKYIKKKNLWKKNERNTANLELQDPLYAGAGVKGQTHVRQNIRHLYSMGKLPRSGSHVI